MRVLVTGGAGYVGSHAVLELKKAGHEPVVFDNLMRGHRSVVETLGVPFIEGDLSCEADITNALKSEKFDAVMHFAAVALVGESVRDPGFYYTVNVGGGLNLLNAMRASGCKRLIFSSTCAVYGKPAKLPMREDFPLNPVNPYGHTKLAFEHMMRAFAEAYNFKTLALRYFNAAGADPSGNFGEIHHPETHLIPNVLKVALGLSKTVMIFGSDYETQDGTCVRDYVHVCDLARIHVLALEHLDGLPIDALNVGTGRGTSVKEIVDLARKVTGHPIPVMMAPRREGDPPELVASPEKAEELLGFEAEYDVESMIATAWGFLKSHMELVANRPIRFGEAAVALNLMSEADVETALAEQKRRNESSQDHILFGLILVDMGLLRNSQLIDVLRYMNARKKED
jgi:UDP-glucose 4-epimerase